MNSYDLKESEIEEIWAIDTKREKEKEHIESRYKDEDIYQDMLDEELRIIDQEDAQDNNPALNLEPAGFQSQAQTPVQRAQYRILENRREELYNTDHSADKSIDTILSHAKEDGRYRERDSQDHDRDPDRDR